MYMQEREGTWELNPPALKWDERLSAEHGGSFGAQARAANGSTGLTRNCINSFFTTWHQPPGASCHLRRIFPLSLARTSSSKLRFNVPQRLGKTSEGVNTFLRSPEGHTIPTRCPLLETSTILMFAW